jgi:hypothetical protein
MFSLPDIVRASKAKRTGWEGHLGSLGENKNAYNVLVGKPEGNKSLGRPGLREIILKWISLSEGMDTW